jgi:hypothetical protein
MAFADFGEQVVDVPADTCVRRLDTCDDLGLWSTQKNVENEYRALVE